MSINHSLALSILGLEKKVSFVTINSSIRAEDTSLSPLSPLNATRSRIKALMDTSSPQIGTLSGGQISPFEREKISGNKYVVDC